jgi:hypothetical protein
VFSKTRRQAGPHFMGFLVTFRVFYAHAAYIEAFTMLNSSVHVSPRHRRKYPASYRTKAAGRERPSRQYSEDKASIATGRRGKQYVH